MKKDENEAEIMEQSKVLKKREVYDIHVNMDLTCAYI